MDIKRLESMSYSEGYIEDYLEEHISGVEKARENAGLPPSEQMVELRAAWQILTSGLKELRRENSALATKVNATKLVILS